MIGNENGFLYPLTLCFLLFFTMLLLSGMEQFLTMKKLTVESESILKMETQLLRTVQILEDRLVEEEPIPSPGRIIFSDIEAEYVPTQVTESLWDIMIFMKQDGKIVFRAHAYFDCDIQRVIKWVEL